MTLSTEDLMILVPRWQSSSSRSHRGSTHALRSGVLVSGIGNVPSTLLLVRNAQTPVKQFKTTTACPLLYDAKVHQKRHDILPR